MNKLLSLRQILRGGAVVARWAHNPKVVGSNPTPATRNKRLPKGDRFFCAYTEG